MSVVEGPEYVVDSGNPPSVVVLSTSDESAVLFVIGIKIPQKDERFVFIEGRKAFFECFSAQDTHALRAAFCFPVIDEDAKAFALDVEFGFQNIAVGTVGTY